MKICSRQEPFELISANHSAGSGDIIFFFLIFLNMEVCRVFSLESPHQGDSNEYTQYTIFNIKKKVTINYPKSAAIPFFSKGLKDEIETAVVNEPSVFEPRKFYCISFNSYEAFFLKSVLFSREANR